MSIHPSRASETREATGRQRIGGEHKGRLDFDPKHIPAGTDVCWIREFDMASGGQRDDENLIRAYEERGYRPMTTDQMPSLSRPSIPGIPNAADDKVVRRGGLILMGRPKEYADEDKADLAALNARNEQSVARVSNDPSAQMDGTNFRDDPSNRISSRTTRGGGGKFAE